MNLFTFSKQVKCHWDTAGEIQLTKAIQSNTKSKTREVH